MAVVNSSLSSVKESKLNNDLAETADTVLDKIVALDEALVTCSQGQNNPLGPGKDALRQAMGGADEKMTRPCRESSDNQTSPGAEPACRAGGPTHLPLHAFQGWG